MALLAFLKSLPALLTAFLELKKLVESCVEDAKRVEAMKKLSGALKDARGTGDMKSVEQVLRDIINNKS